MNGAIFAFVSRYLYDKITGSFKPEYESKLDWC